MEEKLSQFLDELKDHTKNLFKKYLKEAYEKAQANNSLEVPEYDYYDIQAYCILMHAGLEEFFEKTTFELIKYAVVQWKQNNIHSITITSLMTVLGDQKVELDDDSTTIKSLHEYFEKTIEGAYSKFERNININHGAKTRYLKNMTVPAGIDISDIPNLIVLLRSLEALAKYRGDYAHSYSKKKIPDIIEIKKNVDDCINLSEHIVSKAKEIVRQIYQSIK